MKRILRIVILLVFASAVLVAFSNFAQAQKMDIAFGVSTVDAPGISNANGVDHLPVSLTGGAYPGFSADVLFFHNAGVGAEFFWKASQSDYAGQGFNYRPVMWDVNAVYSPKLASHAYLELVGGIGALSTRYYTGTDVRNATVAPITSRSTISTQISAVASSFIRRAISSFAPRRGFTSSTTTSNSAPTTLLATGSRSGIHSGSTMI